MSWVLRSTQPSQFILGGRSDYGCAEPSRRSNRSRTLASWQPAFRDSDSASRSAQYGQQQPLAMFGRVAEMRLIPAVRQEQAPAGACPVSTFFVIPFRFRRCRHWQHRLHDPWQRRPVALQVQGVLPFARCSDPSDSPSGHGPSM